MRLYPQQAKLKQDIYNAWNSGAKNVLGVSPTGSGKTVIFSDVLKDHNAPCCAIAHRQELVSQISQALARDEVRHRIIGPQSVVRLVVNNHMNELGRSYYDPSSHTAVAGIDTLTRRRESLSHWSKSVTKWIMDEGHHVLTANKWGIGASMFKNAIGLGVTATPTRADGKGLGRYADGVYDEMVEGPGMRDLINMGYLTDYRIFAPPSDLDLTNVNVGNSGDYVQQQLQKAVRKSHIIGDVVEHYLRIAPGKLGVTFVTDVETANDTAREYNRRGVPAEVVTAKTPDAERIAILKRFKNKELLNLVNVDLFGEGFDLPAIEVVSMARPTQSFSLFCQQFGRALRLMISPILQSAWGNYTDAERLAFIAASEKPNAIIIDHVGNISGARGHGLPDAPRVWSLDARRGNGGGNQDEDAIPVTTCTNPACLSVYERIYAVCPYCGTKPVPGDRSRPEFVDGVLTELDPATLANMRGEVARVDMDPEVFRQECKNKYMPHVGVLANVKRHVERQEVQEALRTSIAWWGAYQRDKGVDDTESQKRFFWKFGIDILTAQALNSKEALELAGRINTDLGKCVTLPEVDTDPVAVQIIKMMPDIVTAREVLEVTGLNRANVNDHLIKAGFKKYKMLVVNDRQETIYVRKRKGKKYTDCEIREFYNPIADIFNNLPDIITFNEAKEITKLNNTQLITAFKDNGYIKYKLMGINGIQDTVYIRKGTLCNDNDIRIKYDKDDTFDKLPDIIVLSELSKKLNIPNKRLCIKMTNNGFNKLNKRVCINNNNETIYIRKGTPAEHYNNNQIRNAL